MPDVARVDTGCVPSGAEASVTECGDGVDNDCDGYTDCVDRNCSCVGRCGGYVAGCACRGPEATNGACGDGVDNDCNSFTDCMDFACSRNPAVSVCGDGGAR